MGEGFAFASSRGEHHLPLGGAHAHRLPDGSDYLISARLSLLTASLRALGPQRALVNGAALEGVPLHLGAGLLLHDLNILLEGHLLDVQQSLDGQACEEGRTLPDGKAALRSIHHQSDPLAGEALGDRVGVQVDHDTAIGADRARHPACWWNCCSQRSGWTVVGSGGSLGRAGQATRGGRLPQARP